MRMQSKPGEEPAAGQSSHSGWSTVPQGSHRAGPKRRWSAQEKRAIVEESYDPNLTVTAVARKHHVSSVSLYHWRKKFSPSPLRILDAAKARSAKALGQPHVWDPVQAFVPSPLRVPGSDGETTTVSPDIVRRIQDLTDEIAALKVELEARNTHRRFLIEIVRTISEQLRLLAEVDDVSQAAELTHAGRGQPWLRPRPGD